jgi:predicted DNA-binding transcriptional regulator AlpA
MELIANQKKTRESRRPKYVLSDPLITVKEAAAERGQGVSTFWRDVKNGGVPSPYYVGPKTPRWRLSEIRASVEACRKGAISPRNKSNSS